MTDKNISTEYTGVYTGIFPNMSPREIELEARVKELKSRLEEYEKYGGVIDQGREWAALANCYLKALEEIEEIAKGMRSVFIEEISITASQLNDRIYWETTARFRQILNIINKVKGD